MGAIQPRTKPFLALFLLLALAALLAVTLAISVSGAAGRPFGTQPAVAPSIVDQQPSLKAPARAQPPPAQVQPAPAEVQPAAEPNPGLPATHTTGGLADAGPGVVPEPGRSCGPKPCPHNP